MSLQDSSQFIHRAAETIFTADALLITAGAGIGVDSGLPDFRGDQGFWRAYPALRGYSFIDMANPKWFATDPHRAWGFYGHRLNLYRSTRPHQGFHILKRWVCDKDHESFIFTSNVDGQFQKAGFDERIICECHGSIHHVQTFSSQSPIFAASSIHIKVDEEQVRVIGDLPTHPHLSGPIRPNILMFGDSTWCDRRTEAQEERFQAWRHVQHSVKVAVIELGGGTAIPSVRYTGEAFTQRNSAATLIRINPREADVPPALRARSISLAMGAHEALTAIDHAYQRLKDG